MLTVYCWLLCLYPGSYRSDFGEEMTCVFRDADNEPFERDIRKLMACHDGTSANQDHGGRAMCRWCAPRSVTATSSRS